MVSLLIRILVNNYNNTSDEKVRQGYGVVCGGMGIILNILLCCAKAFIGMMSGSIAVITDAVNNLTDAGSSLISIVGFKMAGRKPDPEHPFGHGRIEYVAGLIISIIIIVLGVEMGKTSVTKIIDPADIFTSKSVFLCLEISIGVKIYMYLYNKHFGDKVQSPTMVATAVDSFTDAIATTGVLISVILYEFAGMLVDGWCGLVVSVFIIYSGVKSVKATVDPLLGSRPDPEYVKVIEKYVLAQKGVLGMHDLIIHNYGPGRSMISLHVEVPANSSLVDAHDSIDNIERKLREVLNCECIIHMDPIVMDDSVTARMREYIGIIVTNVDPSLSVHDFRMVQGSTHTNLIFDLVIPHGLAMSDEAVVDTVKRRVAELPGNHYAVINVDKPYV
ncbi:MAG: cation transporter [Lachnospiraceae bacterium]|nr:cation transporter [Lachnospiraceae bacterium]MBR6485140.1 cation transporter [Lachnospiraceae bacterium]